MQDDDDQDDLFGGKPPSVPYARGSDTSKAAAESKRGTVRADSDRVFRFIKEAGYGGATCWEVERALKMPHQSASARICHLKDAKHVADSGARRPTQTGRLATVWVVP